MFPTIDRASNFYFLIDSNTREVVQKSLVKVLTDQQRFASRI